MERLQQNAISEGAQNIMSRMPDEMLDLTRVVTMPYGLDLC